MCFQVMALFCWFVRVMKIIIIACFHITILLFPNTEELLMVVIITTMLQA
ncbi:MAG: hypothetical protein H6R43_887 [Nitrospirae bacterium]|nr:hypothetical protein [Nitrospirota bacterium]